MENSFPSDTIQLPPGFRFHPTDEELITHYLSPKVLDPSFSPLAVADADLNKSEPWDLPWRAKMGESEWYFFCVKDRKYPTGLRTNRATHAGYWKATGKDREIFKAKVLIGMKKTLVFYRGRAPKGGKTNWVMHEYRLHPKLPHDHEYGHDLSSKNEWVLCRVFQKISGGTKKMVLEIGADGSELPPLMEESPNQTTEFGESSHVTCFSGDPNQSEDPRMTRDDSNIVVESQVLEDNNNDDNNNNPSQLQLPNSFLENNGWGGLDLDGDISSVIYNGNDMILQRSFQNQQYYSSSSPSAGPVHDIGCLWN